MAHFVARLPGRHEVVGSKPGWCVTFLAENIAVLSGRLVVEMRYRNTSLLQQSTAKFLNSLKTRQNIPWRKITVAKFELQLWSYQINHCRTTHCLAFCYFKKPLTPKCSRLLGLKPLAWCRNFSLSSLIVNEKLETRRPLSTGIFSAKNVTHQPGFEPTTS